MFAVAEEEDEEESRLVARGLSADETRVRVAENGIKPWPDETDVTDLAGLSLDPMGLSGLGEPPGLGWAARLPKHLAD